MKITIRGETLKNGRRAKLTTLSMKEIRYAAMFFADQLMSARMYNTLSVQIMIDPTMGFFGDACPIEFDDYAPKVFDVGLNPTKSRVDQLRTIAHELVHVKQWATNERRDLLRPKDIVKFRTGYYRIDAPDKDVPWEKEAYRREKQLYKKYVAHLKQYNITF